MAHLSEAAGAAKNATRFARMHKFDLPNQRFGVSLIYARDVSDDVTIPADSDPSVGINPSLEDDSRKGALCKRHLRNFLYNKKRGNLRFANFPYQ